MCGKHYSSVSITLVYSRDIMCNSNSYPNDFLSERKKIVIWNDCLFSGTIVPIYERKNHTRAMITLDV
jgi:hypothetical protein